MSCCDTRKSWGSGTRQSSIWRDNSGSLTTSATPILSLEDALLPLATDMLERDAMVETLGPRLTPMANGATVWAERLLHLGLRVQSRLVGLLHDPNTSRESLSQPVREAAGDRIYALDDAVESLIAEDIAAWPADCLPLLLIAEGIGAEGLTRFGDPDQPLKFRVLIDPIDGTRMLMSDKRSAWFLAAVALDRGETTSLADTFASVMVELPPTKQTQADCFSAIRGGGVRGRRVTVAADSAPERLLEFARD